MTNKYISVRIWTKSYERFRKKAFKNRRSIIQVIDDASVEKKGVPLRELKGV